MLESNLSKLYIVTYCNICSKLLHLLVLVIALCVFMGLSVTSAQNMVSGTIMARVSDSIYLYHFDGFDAKKIGGSAIDNNGAFNISYSIEHIGIGYLSIGSMKHIVVLENTARKLETMRLQVSPEIELDAGVENQFFHQYAAENPRREQTLSAWSFLRNKYQSDSLFNIQANPKSAIDIEMARISAEDSTFLAQLPKSTYVSWYLPVRKLISSVSSVAQYRPSEISTTIDAFRSFDLTDKRWQNSGLLRDALESHFWLIENSGLGLDSMYMEMKLSIDNLIDNLLANDALLSSVMNHLFDILERHSLSQASEHLALRLLNETSCTLNSDLAAQLETYRAMKKGKVAADIDFTLGKLSGHANNNPAPQRLSNIDSDQILVVFAASWCPKCKTEVPEIAQLYPKWKDAGLEVILITLDENLNEFYSFTNSLPFLSYCDTKKWDSPPVKDFYVFGTPTMFLLDRNRKILLRPTSVNQMNAWVDWYLLKKDR